METVHGFDLVIDGSGADAMWFVPLFRQDALDLLELVTRGLKLVRLELLVLPFHVLVVRHGAAPFDAVRGSSHPHDVRER